MAEEEGEGLWEAVSKRGVRGNDDLTGNQREGKDHEGGKGDRSASEQARRRREETEGSTTMQSMHFKAP